MESNMRPDFNISADYAKSALFDDDDDEESKQQARKMKKLRGRNESSDDRLWETTVSALANPLWWAKKCEIPESCPHVSVRSHTAQMQAENKNGAETNCNALSICLHPLRLSLFLPLSTFYFALFSPSVLLSPSIYPPTLFSLSLLLPISSSLITRHRLY